MGDDAIRVNDVSLTDGQSAVWGGGLTSGMRLFALDGYETRGETSGETCGFGAVEVISSETILQAVSRGEDPWQYLDLLAHQAGSLTLRACLDLFTGHGRKGFDRLEDDLLAAWVSECVARGIGEIVIVDPALKPTTLSALFAQITALGAEPVGALIYEGEHISDAEYVGQTKLLREAGATRLMLRDEAGILTSDALATLLPLLLPAMEAGQLCVHTRCTTGLGPAVLGDAIKMGVREVDTALPVLANGASTPSSLNLVHSLDAIDISIDTLDLEAIEKLNATLSDLGDSERFARACPWGFDFAPYIHRLPGAVAAWAEAECAKQGLRGAKLHEFAHECARIRADIGNPPPIAPIAQAIAEQAFLNLKSDVRYHDIRPSIRRAIQGAYGQSTAPDPELQAWLGNVPTPEPVSLATMKASVPGAPLRKLLLRALTGLTSEKQAGPQKLGSVLYQLPDPAELLRTGMRSAAEVFGSVHITGPDVDIQEHGGEMKC